MNISMKIEVDVLPISHLPEQELTEKRRTVYAMSTSQSHSYRGWVQLQVWKDGTYVRWTDTNDNLGHCTAFYAIPYTHYAILPEIVIK
jgi:hypothetical protein